MMNRLETGQRSVVASVVLVILFILFVSIVVAQPSPHNVIGRVTSDAYNGVQNGIPVTVNDTVTGDFVATQVNAPPIPQLMGSYALTITGNDGDAIVARAWNATHYGINNTFLDPTTTRANIVLNTTRDSEANVTIFFPGNNSDHNIGQHFLIRANVTMLGANGIDCNASLNLTPPSATNFSSGQLSTIPLGNINLGDNVTATFNVTAAGGQTFNATVTATCESDDIYWDNMYFQFLNLTNVDTLPPEIFLLSPANNTYVGANASFTYFVYDPSDVANCSLFVDGMFNQTHFFPLDGQNTFYINGTPDGTHLWDVQCYDNSDEHFFAFSENFTFLVDKTPPNVTLLSNANNTITSNNTLRYVYNVSDNVWVANCSLIVDDVEVDTNLTIIQNGTNQFTYTAPSVFFNWSVTCLDNASNLGLSDLHFLNITDPDLFVNLSLVTFSVGSFVEDQNISINVTVLNIGTANATNVTVTLFENDPELGGTPIAANVTVNITASANASIGWTYITEVGSTDFFITVDPTFSENGSIEESNETNNQVNFTITIVPYHLFYGDILSNIILDTLSNSSLINWLNATHSNGTLMVADSDSDVNFAALESLSRNASHNFTDDDFSDLDAALNTTELADSLNRSYYPNGELQATFNFSVQSNTIFDTPITNSTNSSFFVTGILWDTSDVNTGEFNGSQDVLFITSVNPDRIGTYGSYDYEINVPARLRSYVVPNLDDSVSFYRELT